MSVVVCVSDGDFICGAVMYTGVALCICVRSKSGCAVNCASAAGSAGMWFWVGVVRLSMVVCMMGGAANVCGAVRVFCCAGVSLWMMGAALLACRGRGLIVVVCTGGAV